MIWTWPPSWDNYSFILNVIGVGLGVASLIVVWVQARGAKTAAQEAREAALAAVARVEQVLRVASVEQLCGRSRELVTLSQQKRHRESLRSSFELLEGVTKLAAQDVSPSPAEGWTNLVAKVKELHSLYQIAAGINKMDAATRESAQQLAAAVHHELIRVAATAAGKVMDLHANSRTI